MKKILISVLLALTVTFCFGQIVSPSVPFISYWNVGDSYDFQITKIRKQIENAEIKKSDSISYIASFLVIDSTESSYTVKWSYKTQLMGVKIPDEIRDKLNDYQLTEVIYKTNEYGEFIGVENWEEISEITRGVFTEVMTFASKNTGIAIDSLQKGMLPLINAMSSKGGIEIYVVPELRVFHFPLGAEFSTNEPFEYQEELPNLLGGDPIRGDTKIYFDSIDFENSFCVLIQEMKLNPDDTRKMLVTFFESMNLGKDEMVNAMKTANVEITDRNVFQYWYDPGIPYRIETHRETVLDIADEKGKRIDIMRIELME